MRLTRFIPGLLAAVAALAQTNGGIEGNARRDCQNHLQHRPQLDISFPTVQLSAPVRQPPGATGCLYLEQGGRRDADTPRHAGSEPIELARRPRADRLRPHARIQLQLHLHAAAVARPARSAGTGARELGGQRIPVAAEGSRHQPGTRGSATRPNATGIPTEGARTKAVCSTPPRSPRPLPASTAMPVPA